MRPLEAGGSLFVALRVGRRRVAVGVDDVDGPGVLVLDPADEELVVLRERFQRGLLALAPPLVFGIHPVDDGVVEVLTPQEGVPSRGEHLEALVLHGHHRDSKSTATEVENGNFDVFVLLVKSVCQCCGSRFVDDPADFQPCDFPGFLGGLPL